MTSIRDAKPSALIQKTAQELKAIKEMQAPEWSRFVKTGAGKERPPVAEDWWQTRAAAVLRRVAVTGLVGVSKLRNKYSAKKNMGHAPERVYRASGKIIRTILQQLEKSGLVKYTQRGVKKGREITPKGMSLLAKAAKLAK